MRRQTWSGMLAATVFAATVGLVAQSSSTSQNSPQPAAQAPTTARAPATSPPPSSEGRSITVAGCLQAAPSGPTGTSGSAAAPAAGATDAAANAPSGDAKFVLVNAVPSPAETSASASNSSAPRTYQLIANEGALTPLVGKRLELTGTIEDQDSAARSANSESKDSSAANAPKLRVLAGKVLAEACTQ